jgi:hypothetical protein
MSLIPSESHSFPDEFARALSRPHRVPKIKKPVLPTVRLEPQRPRIAPPPPAAPRAVAPPKPPTPPRPVTPVRAVNGYVPTPRTKIFSRIPRAVPLNRSPAPNIPVEATQAAADVVEHVEMAPPADATEQVEMVLLQPNVTEQVEMVLQPAEISEPLPPLEPADAPTVFIELSPPLEPAEATERFIEPSPLLEPADAPTEMFIEPSSPVETVEAATETFIEPSSPVEAVEAATETFVEPSPVVESIGALPSTAGPRVKKLRNPKFVRFALCEAAALSVFIPSAILVVSRYFTDPGMMLFLNIFTIAGAIVAAIIPILFFGIAPALPPSDR